MELPPLISGRSCGPLGLVHLPRFWLKMRAHAAGVLPDGYRHGAGGTDEALLAAIGLDGNAFAAFIAREEPDYQHCEGWVRAHAADTSPATIAAFNAHWTAFEMPEPRRSEWTERFGLTGGTYTNGMDLNQLDDWATVHDILLAAEDEAVTPFVPAVSSSVAGPLGVLHLPRLWLKHLLHSLGRLPAGYRHGPGGFDEMVTGALGLDRDAFASYVETEHPSYLAAEAWVRAHATALTPVAIGALATLILTTDLPDDQTVERRAQLGITDPSLNLAVTLNDFDDWAGLHRQLQAAAR